MSVKYISQKCNELELSLFDRTLSKNLFQIYANDQIEGEIYRAELWIIGSSHVVNFTNSTSSVCEVVRAKEYEIPDEGKIKNIELWDKNDNFEYKYPNPKITYRISFRSKTHSPKEFEIRQKKYCECRQERSLLFKFPKSTNADSKPFTLLNYEPKVDILKVNSIHSYPNDLAFIITESEFSV